MAALVLAALDPGQRRTVAGVWAYRARSEREAEARFGRLARQLADHDARPGVAAQAVRAAEDEARHTRICGALADAYGHAGAAPAAPVAGEIGAPGVRGRDRLLYEVVAFCCITESINAALMAVTYQEAEVPEVRETVRQILADEISHSRLGWAHLGAERARAAGGFLAEFLPRMLAGAVAEELFTPAQGPPDAVLIAHGELPEATRLAILTATLRDVVFPGLALHGVDCTAGQAWLAQRGSPGQG